MAKIIAGGRPDALLPTIGGQTALNLAIELAERGILARYNVELIGATIDAIKKAEDRELFKAAMQRIGLAVPRSGIAHTMDDARALATVIGLPLIIRPSRTLGGPGGAIFRRGDYLLILLLGALGTTTVSALAVPGATCGVSGVVFATWGAAAAFGLRYGSALPPRYRRAHWLGSAGGPWASAR